MQTKMLINGELINGEGDALDIHDPATGDVICTINSASSEQVALACESAHKAFEGYSQTTPAERSALLHAICDKIEEHAQELASLESMDVGKPWPSAHDDEMPLIIDTFRFFAGAAEDNVSCHSWRICRWSHKHDTKRSRWASRGHCPMELSIDDGGMETSCTSCGWLHRDFEAI